MKVHQIVLTIALCVAVSNSYACSCRNSSVAYIGEFYSNIVMLKVRQPTLKEHFSQIFETKKANQDKTKKYKVEVLENIKGNFDFDYVETYAHEDGNCGVDVKHGDTLYVTYLKAPTRPYLSICNSTSALVANDFLTRVRTYIKSNKESQKPLVLSEFTTAYNDKETHGLVNYKTKIVEDKYVTLWLLTNFKKNKEEQDYKSIKTQVKISCEHKKYNINSIYYYAEFNATGKLVDIAENEAEEFYEWKDIAKGFPLASVMKQVCKA